eukprot:1683432-Ditylum_brightwellii.AAC.1
MFQSKSTLNRSIQKRLLSPWDIISKNISATHLSSFEYLKDCLDEIPDVCPQCGKTILGVGNVQGQ